MCDVKSLGAAVEIRALGKLKLVICASARSSPRPLCHQQ
jgi:hypothetical protein